VPYRTSKCVFVSSINESLASLDLCAVNGADQSRIVVFRWTTPPRIDNAIQQVLEDFAAVARSAWPSWFGLPTSTAIPDQESLLQVSSMTKRRWNVVSSLLVQTCTVVKSIEAITSQCAFMNVSQDPVRRRVGMTKSETIVGGGRNVKLCQ